jgi:DNA-binding beta-propeller fold protein YncE
LWIPSFEKEHWNVMDANTGEIIKTIDIAPGFGAHNTVCSLDGKHAYLAGRLGTPSQTNPCPSQFLHVFDCATLSEVKKIGPFSNRIRPFTIDGAQKRCYINCDELLGFEIGDITTGKKLAQLVVKGFEKGKVKRHACPSHGIGLTPDEKEVWICDLHNSRIHVFDNTVMPPKQIASIEVRDQPGWITFSLDGRYAYPSSGEVIDTKTKKTLFKLQDEKGRPVQSEKVVEVVFVDKRSRALFYLRPCGNGRSVQEIGPILRLIADRGLKCAPGAGAV